LHKDHNLVSPARRSPTNNRAVLGGNPLGLKAATLALSVSAHAAVALMAAHGGSPRGASDLPEVRALELPAPELVVVETPSAENLSNEPARAELARSHRVHHTHPYPVAVDHDVTPHDPSVPHIPLPDRTADLSPAPPPAVIEGPSTAPARFVLTVGRQTSAPGGVVSANGRESETPSGSAAPAREESVDAAATLLSASAPAYTREAQSAGVEADVPLEIVVDDRGNVVAARALQHVGYGLDEVALQSIRGYRFKAARRGGRPVAVRMRWLVRFELR
jgi:protein TonB